MSAFRIKCSIAIILTMASLIISNRLGAADAPPTTAEREAAEKESRERLAEEKRLRDNTDAVVKGIRERYPPRRCRG